MADVQLEHGFLRIANALDEALTYAPFKTMSQMKIARCIVRMTFGWRQRTIKVSVGGLAQRCNVPYSGAFRRALDDLIREGVVVQVRRGIGAEAGVYAINKDHENWGHYSVASKMLERLFRTRLPADDDALAGVATQPSLIASQGANASEGDSRPSEGEYHDGDHNSGHLPSGGHTNPQPAQVVRPLEGEQNRDNPPNQSDLQGRKDIESNSIEKQTTTATASDGVKGVRQSDFAMRIVSAMNAAIEKRWGEQINPLTFGQCQQLAADLIHEEFTDVDVSRLAIDAACTASRQPTPPAHPNYFRNVIREAHQRAIQKSFDADTKRSSGSLATIAQVVDPAAHAMEIEMETNWKRERRLTAVNWGNDPENATAYRTIVSECNAKFDGMLETSWAKKGRDLMVIERCELACNFPAFDVWRANRTAGRRTSAASTDDAECHVEQ